MPDDTSAHSAATASPPRPRRNLWLWLLVVLVVLVVAGVAGARPAYRVFKNWRAEQFANQAEEFARQQKWREAYDKAQGAVQLSPNNPRCQRLVATLLNQFGSEAAMWYWDQLLTGPDARLGDREEALQAAIRMGRGDLADRHASFLITNSATSTRGLLLLSELARLRNDATNAILLARAAHRKEPENPTNIVAYGSILLSASDAKMRIEGKELIRTLAATNGPFQLRAIQLLAARPDANRLDREDCLRLLDGLAERDFSTELLRRDIQVQLDPLRKLEIAEDTVQRYGRGKPEEVAAVGAWLVRHDLPARAIELIQPEEAYQSDALFRVRFEALMAAGQDEDAYRFLLDPKARGEEMPLELLRLRTAEKLKREQDVQQHWQRLLKIAGSDARSLRILAETAERGNSLDTAVSAYRALTGIPYEEENAWRNIIRLLDAQGDTWNARDAARRLLRLKKEDEALDMQITYYDLLLAEDVERSLQKAQALVKQSPTNLLNRVVLALGELRNNNPVGAREAISGVTVDWTRIPPGARAVLVATLGANQQNDAAARLLARLPLKILKPEERELIRPYVDLPIPPDSRLLDAAATNAPSGG
ncbi:MAG: hypothetical protein ACKVYV_04035 [Limisphaerales bacterium]